MKSAEPDLTRPDGSPLRVLVVDDEENIAELLRMALRYEGWDVDVALNGAKAVSTAKRQRPDAVVLDMMLPDWDGMEVLRRMRTDAPDVPVLFLTARDSVEDRVAGLTAGGDDIALTATEFELLRFLMRNPRRVLSKAQILDRVWNYDFGGQANVVELYISYLRKKVDAGREPMIHTMRGAGYVLKPAASADQPAHTG